MAAITNLRQLLQSALNELAANSSLSTLRGKDCWSDPF